MVVWLQKGGCGLYLFFYDDLVAIGLIDGTSIGMAYFASLIYRVHADNILAST